MCKVIQISLFGRCQDGHPGAGLAGHIGGYRASARPAIITLRDWRS
jgi:hypothetical protein